MSAVPHPDFAEYIDNGGEPIRPGFFRIRDRGEWIAIIVRRSRTPAWEWEAEHPNGDTVNAETVWTKAVRNPIDGETYRAMCPKPQRPQQNTPEAKTMQTETLAIEQSAEVAELMAALAKAQGEIKNALKESVNPAFLRDGKKVTYADLASVVDACRPALTKHNVAVIQMPTNLTDGAVAVTTRLALKGEWLQSTIAAKPSKFDAQGVGSVITYLRRYGLAAMVGVAPEDDDGNGATGKGDPSGASNDVGGPPAAPPKPRAEPKAETKAEPTTQRLARWWAGDDLKIPKLRLSWQEWQSKMLAAIAGAPDKARLDKLMADNAYDLNALQAESPKGHAMISAAVKTWAPMPAIAAE